MGSEPDYSRLISVVMPNYNHGIFIEAAISAVLAQKGVDVEVIVVDDQSTDDSVARVRRLEAQHPNLQLHTPGKLGSIQCSNYGLARAKGAFVCFFAPDDLIYPSLLKRSVDLLDKFPAANICFSDAKFVNEAIGIAWQSRFNIGDRDMYLPSSDVIAAGQKAEFWVIGASTMWRTSRLRAIGGWNEALGWTADWFLSFTEALRNGVCYIPEALAAIRVSNQSFSVKDQSRHKKRKAVFETIVHGLTRGPFADVQQAFVLSGAVLQLGVDFRSTVSRAGVKTMIWEPWFLRRVMRIYIAALKSAMPFKTPLTVWKWQLKRKAKIEMPEIALRE